MALYTGWSVSTDESPYQKLALIRTWCFGPNVSAALFGAMTWSNVSSHGYAPSYAPACASLEPAVSIMTAPARRWVESADASPGRR